MMFYLVSNTRLDNSFDFHQCAWFTHNTKASHETYVKRICRYLQGTKDKGVVLNSPKRMVANFYVDECFLVLWGHDNSQDPSCDKIRTGCVVTYSNFPLLLVSKIHTDIALYNLYYEYVVLYTYVRYLIPLKSIIKEVVDKLVMDSDKLNFASNSTVYEDNNSAIVVGKIPRMTPNSKKMAFKYHWFRYHVGK